MAPTTQVRLLVRSCSIHACLEATSARMILENTVAFRNAPTGGINMIAGVMSPLCIVGDSKQGMKCTNGDPPGGDNGVYNRTGWHRRLPKPTAQTCESAPIGGIANRML